jgi:hypothetical protein
VRHPQAPTGIEDCVPSLHKYGIRRSRGRRRPGVPVPSAQCPVPSAQGWESRGSRWTVDGGRRMRYLGTYLHVVEVTSQRRYLPSPPRYQPVGMYTHLAAWHRPRCRTISSHLLQRALPTLFPYTMWITSSDTRRDEMMGLSDLQVATLPGDLLSKCPDLSMSCRRPRCTGWFMIALVTAHHTKDDAPSTTTRVCITEATPPPPAATGHPKA